MGGMPDFERIMDDIEGVQADAQPAKVAARVAEAPKQVSADDAKSAVETALAANGLELGSSEKRQARVHSSSPLVLFYCTRRCISAVSPVLARPLRC